MKRLFAFVIVLAMAFSFCASAQAFSEADGSAVEQCIRELEAAKEMASDSQEAADIDQIIQDVKSGVAIPVTVISDTSLASDGTRIVYADHYQTYSDGIKKNGVKFGTFYVQCGFDSNDNYVGVNAYWATKKSDVDTLTIQSCNCVYYSSSNCLGCVTTFYVKKTTYPSANGYFAETDYFYF